MAINGGNAQTSASTARSPRTLAPGQVMQLNDVFARFGLTQTAVLAFVDEVSGTGQLRGYAVAKDIVTNDGAFVFMRESQSSTF